MPVHSAATYLSNVDPGHLMLAASTIAGATYAKARAGGRKCTWERDWAGKMIMIVAPPTSTILSLIDYLLHLPRPPQILLLPPYSSPLPDELLTLLNTIRLTLTNPLAQLHCDALPRTPVGVRDFVSKWGKVEQGTTGEGGRRIDAIVLGSGWEVDSTPIPKPTSNSSETVDDSKKQRQWTIHEYHYHFITSLIPALLRQPPERNIRLISLLSPTYSTALPTLQGKPPKVDSAMQISGAKSITTMLLNNHVQLILDILSAAALKKVKPVPNPVEEEKGLKTREDGVQSNIMTIGVVMPWTRDEVIRPVLGVDDGWLRWFLWILFFPIMVIFTPSPRKSIQSIIYALQAPVRYGPLDLTVKPLDPVSEPGTKSRKSKDDSAVSGDPRRSAVGAGDIVRDCSVADMPPVLSDPALCKITYEALEKEVEKGVKDDAKREKAFGN